MTDPLAIMLQEHKDKELKAVMRFIDKASPLECAKMIQEIICVHDNLLAFNPNTRLLCSVESVSLNGECIQLNLDDKESHE